MSDRVPGFVFATLPRQLPAGFAAIPLTQDQESASARLCVIARSGGNTKADGPFVVLREMLDARVLLACVADAAGRVHQYIELWIQDVAGLAGALPTYREALNNKILDERWVDRWKAFEKAADGADPALGAAGIALATGWETRHPEPMFVDTKRQRPVRAVEKTSGLAWDLCRDDALLKRKGLPAYADSLRRYLYVAGAGERSEFIAADGQDDQAAGLDVPALLGFGPEVVAVNPSGGLVMALPHAPLSYEQFIDALGGSAVEGTSEGLLQQLAQRAAGANGAIGVAAGGWLTPPAGALRAVEVLTLKLRAFTEAVALIRMAAESGPLLNVSADSFRVRLSQGVGGNAGLPLWWTAQTAFVRPGEAVELPIVGTQARYYLPGSDQLSIYTPASAGRGVQGRGTLRIRRVVDASTGSSGGSPAPTGTLGTYLECTLATHERLAGGGSDLVWLRFAVGGTRIDAYGTVEARAGMATGEIRIRTLAQTFDEGVVERLRSAEGVPIPGVMFEVVPLLSTPCDLYAMAVLGARTLLVGKNTTLAVALDDLMSLGAAVAAQPSPVEITLDAVAEAVGRAFEKEPRFAEALGPQRLWAAPAGAGHVPDTVWNQVLAVLLRMLPGQGWFSTCRDFGDAPPGAPDRVFEPALNDLYHVLVQARGLVVPDHGLSREVRGVLADMLAHL